jgi:quinol monooxygenase YgiN
LVHLKVKPQHAADLEALLTDLCEKVREHEPGVTYYAFGKSVEDPNTYVVVEVYQNLEARSAHMLAAWVRESLPKAASLVDGEPDIRQYVSPGSVPVPAHARLQKIDSQ